MEEQFAIALQLVHEGRITAIDMTTFDIDEEVIRWTAQWIQSVSDLSIKNVTEKSHLKPPR